MDEITKVVFNKASPEQIKIMVNVMTHTTRAKKLKLDVKQEFSRNELRQLFNLYDEDGEKRLPVSKLSAAFGILNINSDHLKKIFVSQGLSEDTDSLDAEEFVEIFFSYLKMI